MENLFRGQMKPIGLRLRIHLSVSGQIIHCGWDFTLSPVGEGSWLNDSFHYLYVFVEYMMHTNFRLWVISKSFTVAAPALANSVATIHWCSSKSGSSGSCGVDRAQMSSMGSILQWWITSTTVSTRFASVPKAFDPSLFVVCDRPSNSQAISAPWMADIPFKQETSEWWITHCPVW